MAKYTYTCRACGFEFQKYAGADVVITQCMQCSNITAERKLPTLNGPTNVTEVVNKHTGVTQRRDQRDEVEQRRAEYYWTVEVPRFVSSGTYSIETMLENGWIWVDDNLQVHVHNKPPHRR
jgi:predicted ATP-dependent serine protease